MIIPFLIALLLLSGCGPQTASPSDNQKLREFLRKGEDPSVKIEKRFLEIIEKGKNNKASSKEVLLSLNNLAMLKCGQKKYTEALGYHKQEFILAKDAGQKALMVSSIYNQGLIYGEIGQREKSLRYFKRALKMAKSDPELKNLTPMIVEAINCSKNHVH